MLIQINVSFNSDKRRFLIPSSILPGLNEGDYSDPSTTQQTAELRCLLLPDWG